jgi:trans-aconitate 2-methyltransferase
MKLLSSSPVFRRQTTGLAANFQRLPASRTPRHTGRAARRMASTTAPPDSQAKDWNAAQYLKFEEERTRPVRDLLAQIPVASPRRVVDLGCGPGNSTSVLLARWPNAHITGMDSSPDMIQKARKSLPQLDFELADLATWTPSPSSSPVEEDSSSNSGGQHQQQHGEADVFFSNAVFQWIPYEQRLPLMSRFIGMQASGGVFAIQVPDNYLEPSHALMRETAADGGPWTAILKDRQPALAQFQTVQEIYDHLTPLCQSVNVWHTHYYHILDSHEAVVEWVKGTGLRPYIDPLSDEDRQGFIASYLEKLRRVYPVSANGKVILRYPRLFVVATRK